MCDNFFFFKTDHTKDKGRKTKSKQKQLSLYKRFGKPTPPMSEASDDRAMEASQFKCANFSLNVQILVYVLSKNCFNC